MQRHCKYDLICIIARPACSKYFQQSLEPLAIPPLLFNLYALFLFPAIPSHLQFIYLPSQEGPEADSIKFSLNCLSGIQTKTDGELITAPVGLHTIY